MRASRYRKKINKKILRIILGSILLLVCAGVLTFLLAFHVETVEVVGNTRYTEEEMKEVVLKGPFATNALLISWLKGKQDTKDIPFVESIKVEMVSNHKIRILVNEKQVIGYVRYLDCDMFFDKNGIVVESIVSEQTTASEDGTDVIAPEEIEAIQPEAIPDADQTVFNAAVTDVPLVEGLSYDYVTLEVALPVKNTQVFNTIQGIARMMEKLQLNPDKVSFDEKYNITMYFGSIQVTFGQDTLLEEKITRMAAILPELTGKSGTLHLEDYTDGITSIIFSNDVPEDEDNEGTAADDSDEENTGGYSDTGDDGEDTDQDSEAQNTDENQDLQEDSKTANETTDDQNE